MMRLWLSILFSVGSCSSKKTRDSLFCKRLLCSVRVAQSLWPELLTVTTGGTGVGSDNCFFACSVRNHYSHQGPTIINKPKYIALCHKPVCRKTVLHISNHSRLIPSSVKFDLAEICGIKPHRDIRTHTSCNCYTALAGVSSDFHWQ